MSKHREDLLRSLPGWISRALPLVLVLAACTGYDASKPPAANVTFSLDLPAEAQAAVKIYDDNDQLVGQSMVAGLETVTVAVSPNQDFGTLRVVARAGERVLKGLAANVSREETVNLGQLDAASTATVQILQEKVTGQGGTFSAMPPSAIEDLLSQLAAGGSEIAAFTSLVEKILAAARPEAGAGSAMVFHALDAALDDAFVEARVEALPENIAADYRNALTAAIGRLEVSLICDAALIKVMFTVDVSGQALDGNGAPQLVRQAPKAGKVYLAITVDDSSAIADSAGVLKAQMTPNDPDTAMFDDGTNGDEQAGDGVYTRVLVLPRGIRVKYKYTDGSAGEGWTRTEEWPGNARILEVRDVLTRNSDGRPDCLVIRRDAFGDEASNKNFVNLNSLIKRAGGTLTFEKDLGGPVASELEDGLHLGGLRLHELREQPPLTPAGLAEALENGVCERCPAPLTLSTDDQEPPRLLGAEFLSTSQVKVSFSEAMEFSAASSVKNYLILDSAGRALPILSVAASGASATLEVEGPDFAQRYMLHLKELTDASANANPLPEDQRAIAIERDRTPPQIISVRPLPLRDFNPNATDADPTLGQVLLVTFDEELDSGSAENAGNYTIRGLASDDLETRAAYRKEGNQVWLVTDPQDRRKPYTLIASGVRDLAGNLLRLNDGVAFDGFALYKVTFGAVPGFAFLDLQGQQRGLPPGEGLYLTGTILSVARRLDGSPIGVAGRTDVTGIPEFEMLPSDQLHQGQPVYTISLLAPPGTYAWKVAHGLPGEHVDPPATLVKVHKSLCTTADATGVNIDPVTLSALSLPGGDGQPLSYIDYSGARLSQSGQDSPGPFALGPGQSQPTPAVMFKRENPDEVCTVRSRDVSCPAIVVGTWRDIEAFRIGDKTDDYDDGLPEVAPLRLQADLQAPRLVDLRVRDSESLLLSFDERLAVIPEELELTAKSAKDGSSLAVSLELVGSFGSALLPHQLLLRTAGMAPSEPYTLRYGGLRDTAGNGQPSAKEQSWVAPSSFKPFTPLEDVAPPKVLAVLPKTPSSLLVQFDEKIAPEDGGDAANFTIEASAGQAPQVQAATLQGGGTSVLLSTTLQEAEASYTLIVRDIADLAAPANVLAEQRIAFKGFGDFTPPKVIYAAAISQSEITVAFDEALSPLSAADPASYVISGLSVLQVSFGGDPARKASAFDPARASYSESIVVLQTSQMTAGQSYTLEPLGVTDLSQNACTDQLQLSGVAAPPTVDVIWTYKVTSSETVAGIIPPRAISAATLQEQREGVFMLGSTVSSDGLTKGDPADPLNVQLGSFPPEGSPLDGVEPQLRDDGQGGDAQAGDGVYTLRVSGVPLGTSLLWKAFAPFTVAYKNANPGDAQAAFADATPGPSVFSDGQEFPGNENAVRILGDADGDGVVRLNNLFGDEITYKKFTNAPPFVWVVDDHVWKP